MFQSNDMKKKIEKIQMTISLLLCEDIVEENENSCSRWLDNDAEYIVGYRVPDRIGGTCPGGAFIIFAKDEEDEIFCKIANGIIKEITPEISDELCKELEGLV